MVLIITGTANRIPNQVSWVKLYINSLISVHTSLFLLLIAFFTNMSTHDQPSIQTEDEELYMKVYLRPNDFQLLWPDDSKYHTCLLKTKEVANSTYCTMFKYLIIYGLGHNWHSQQDSQPNWTSTVLSVCTHPFSYFLPSSPAWVLMISHLFRLRMKYLNCTRKSTSDQMTFSCYGLMTVSYIPEEVANSTYCTMFKYLIMYGLGHNWHSQQDSQPSQSSKTEHQQCAHIPFPTSYCLLHQHEYSWSAIYSGRGWNTWTVQRKSTSDQNDFQLLWPDDSTLHTCLLKQKNACIQKLLTVFNVSLLLK